MFELILLDRDGVINQDLKTGVLTRDQFVLLPRVGEAIAQLNRAGLPVSVVTNQACVGRGETTLDELHAIHETMRAALAVAGAHIDQILFCADTTVEPNNRRKPAPGMLIEACAIHGVPPQKAVMIGDALRDLQAAHAAGCQSILVRTGKGERLDTSVLPRDVQPMGIYNDLWDAVQSLCSQGAHT